MRSFSEVGLQYAHRFLGFAGEAQYLHGHSGKLTIEVEDTVNPGVGMVFPCNEIKKIAWSVLQNFDHALILAENDPLLPHVFEAYKQQGILDGSPTNTEKGPAFENALCKAYPNCRLVVVKKVMTVENAIEMFYSLLKDKLNIAKLTFTSGVNGATQEYVHGHHPAAITSKKRCPLCGIEMKNGVCPKCGYKEGK
jgi:6-pyruvoyltetrahydropterin/6-carboxytetrahydropterin synthase